MRILMVHNYYQSAYPSGEAASFEAEAALLESRGHQVLRYTRSNDEFATSRRHRRSVPESMQSGRAVHTGNCGG